MENLHRMLFPFIDALVRSHTDLNILFGIWFGTFLAMFPFGTLQWGLSLIAFFLFRANLLSFLIFFLSLSITSRYLDTVWNSIGFRFLTNNSSLYPVWGWASHAPIMPFTDFNNTVTLGVSISAILLALTSSIFFLFFRKFILKAISKLWYQTKISRFYAHYRRY